MTGLQASWVHMYAWIYTLSHMSTSLTLDVFMPAVDPLELDSTHSALRVTFWLRHNWYFAKKNSECTSFCLLLSAMLSFLQFGLGCHGLPVAAGRLAGAGHVDRAHMVCTCCNSGAVGDEMHLVFECAALILSRQQYASLFTGRTPTPCPARSFGLFRYVIMSKLKLPALLSLETSRTKSIQYMPNTHVYNLCNHTCSQSMQSYLGARLNRMHISGQAKNT